MFRFLKQELVLPLAIATVFLFKLGGDGLLQTQMFSALGIALTVGLFAVVMSAIFAVVRHSDALAIKLGPIRHLDSDTFGDITRSRDDLIGDADW